MPRKVADIDKMHMWTFFCPKLLRAQFTKQVTSKHGTRAAAATVRAMMYLYVIDEEFRKMVEPLVEEQMVTTKTGRQSRL